MKKILVAVVLGFAVAAAGQASQPAQPSQGQPAQTAPLPVAPTQAAPAQGQAPAAASQAPVIKDPAEYNAYVAAGQQGLDCLPKFNKPEGTSDADFQKMKDQMTSIFNAAIGISALQEKDYPTAIKDLRVAVDANPNDFSVVYPLALAYLTPTDPKTPLDPANAVNGIWFAARAAAIAPAQAQAQIEKYARSQYVKYHAGDDGWAEVLAQAKANPTQPAGFTIKPAPTPAEQAHNMVVATLPDKMDFATW